MGGSLTSRQCSKPMESLKGHSFWDLCRTQVRNYFWFILVTVIVLTLPFIHYTRASPEIVKKCSADQANLLRISQLEATLRKQRTEMETEMQKLRKFMNRTQEKNLQLLEKKQAETEAQSKESSGFNQSLVLTRQLLEKEKEKTQSLQSQLEIAQKALQKTQQQRDSWQKQQNTLEEKLKSSNSNVEECKDKIAKLQRQIQEQEWRNQGILRQEREEYDNRFMQLQNQNGYHQQRKCSIEDILDGTIVAWAFGILVLLMCCVKCCRSE